MITLAKNHSTKGLCLLIAVIAFNFQANAFDFNGGKGKLLPLNSGQSFTHTNLSSAFLSTHQPRQLGSHSFFRNTVSRQGSHFLSKDFSNFRNTDLTLNTTGLYSAPKGERFSTRKSPWLAAGMNFFLPGLGYLYSGEQPILTSLGMMAGAVGLTVVELQLQDQAPDLYPIMFGSVMVLNTSIAIVTFKNTKKNNERLGL